MKKIIIIFSLIICILEVKGEIQWDCPAIIHNNQAFKDLLNKCDKDCKAAALQVKDSIGLDKENCVFMYYEMLASDSIDVNNMTNTLFFWLSSKIDDKNKDKIEIKDMDGVRILSTSEIKLKAGGHSNFLEAWNHTINPVVVIGITPKDIKIYGGTRNYTTKHDKGSNSYNESHCFTDTFPFGTKGNDKAGAAAYFYSVIQLHDLSANLLSYLQTNYTYDWVVEGWRKYVSDRSPMVSEYGAPDLTIALENMDFNNEINIFDEKELVVMNGKKFPFNVFKSCEVRDSVNYIPGQVHTTSSSMGAGMMLFGFGLGGASTSSITTKSKDKYIHTYFLDIKTNQIANPYIRIITADEATANHIKSVFDLILERNQSSAQKSSSSKSRRG